MDVAEITKSVFIGKLAGIVEYYNDKEVKWEVNHKSTVTIEFPKNSLKYATIRHYRKDGSLYSLSEYKDNARHGKYFTYYECGNIKKYSKFKNGKVNFSTEYYSNGQTYILSKYNSKGRLNGECIIHYHNGNIQEICSYKNGRKSGPYKTFNEFGQITTEANYLNNSIHGKKIEYYTSGIKRRELEFSHGWQVKIVDYDIDGNIIKHSWY